MGSRFSERQPQSVMGKRKSTQLKGLSCTAEDVYQTRRRCPGQPLKQLFEGLPKDAERGIEILSKHEDIQRTLDVILGCDGLRTGFPLGHLPKMFSSWHKKVRDRTRPRAMDNHASVTKLIRGTHSGCTATI